MSSKVSMEHQVENGETAMEQKKTLYITFMQESNELREKSILCLLFIFIVYCSWYLITRLFHTCKYSMLNIFLSITP